MITFQKQHGFTLIELMVTLLLSLMLTYGISQVLINSNRSALSADGISQSQETGRFVLSFLAKQIRQAGRDSFNNNNSTNSAQIKTPAFIDCTTSNPNECISEADGGRTETNITDTTTLPEHGDRLAISFVATEDTKRDCTGSTTYMKGTTPTEYKVNEIILNTFWVEFDATSSMNSLYCQGHLFDGSAVTGSSSAQVIANGVDAMHFLYGEASEILPNSQYPNVNKYVAADEVTNWDRVYAVKVSILSRSITNSNNNNIQRNYILLDAGTYSMTDAVNRQVFTTTFVINNFP